MKKLVISLFILSFSTTSFAFNYKAKAKASADEFKQIIDSININCTYGSETEHEWIEPRDPFYYLTTFQDLRKNYLFNKNKKVIIVTFEQISKITNISHPGSRSMSNLIGRVPNEEFFFMASVVQGSSSLPLATTAIWGRHYCLDFENKNFYLYLDFITTSDYLYNQYKSDDYLTNNLLQFQF